MTEKLSGTKDKTNKREAQFVKLSSPDYIPILPNIISSFLKMLTNLT